MSNNYVNERDHVRVCISHNEHYRKFTLILRVCVHVYDREST